MTTGYVSVDGGDVYWESRSGGAPSATPLVVVPGGFGVTGSITDLLDQLAERRPVVALELQGHGHTADIDRPFSFEAFGDQVAGAIEGAGLTQADVLGYSVGAQAALHCAIRHPARVRRLVVVSTPVRRDAWFPEVLTGFDHLGSALFDQFRQSPMYAAWAAVAPDPDAFPAIMDKMGDLQRQPYDWTDAVKALAVPTMVVCADADGFPPSHAAEFFALLGGGLRDPGWDAAASTRSCLAVLPGLTHYDIFGSPLLVDAVEDFLSD